MENYCAVCTNQFMNDVEFEEHEICCRIPQINEAVFKDTQKAYH